MAGVDGVGGSVFVSCLELESVVSNEDGLVAMPCWTSPGGVSPSWETWTCKLGEAAGDEPLVDAKDEVA